MSITTNATLAIDQDDLAVALSGPACQVLADARRQVQALGHAFGHADGRTTQAAMTLMEQTVTLLTMGFGDLRVGRDDDLSLYVTTNSGFTCGMIFHRSYMGTSKAPDGTRDLSYGAVRTHLHCFTCDEPWTIGNHSKGEHDLANAPTPGTWVTHS